MRKIVKIGTELIKIGTELVKIETELIIIETELVKIGTELVKLVKIGTNHKKNSQKIPYSVQSNDNRKQWRP